MSVLNTNWGTNSRFNLNSELYEDENGDIQVDFTFPVIPESDTDLYYAIEAGYAYRPDLIALNFYGDNTLAWLLFIANDFEHLKDFYVNRTIIIPDANQLKGQIF